MRFGIADRRARLVNRHLLGRRGLNCVAATEAVAALHSSDPITPHLACFPRVADFRTEDLEKALWEDRTLVRMHAMRRTLFVVPTARAPVFEAGAARRVARAERRKLLGWLDGRDPAWLDGRAERVLAVLSEGKELRTQEIVAAVPELDVTFRIGSGKWVAETPLGSKLLFLMALEGKLVRARPAGTWRSSQYRWALASEWLGRTPVPLAEREGRLRLLAIYLEAFGPATRDDIRWWTGWTAAHLDQAIDDLGAVPVELGDVGGYVAPGDLDTPDVGPDNIAFLPGLDPTPMGWKERDWYLGPHRAEIFDRNGNVGPTVWVDGRVVGGWAQDPSGVVVYELLEAVDGATRDVMAEEARILSEWFDGTLAIPRFRTPLERRLSR